MTLNKRKIVTLLSFLFFSLFFSIFTCTSVLALECDSCRTTIEARYFTYTLDSGDWTVCEDCNKNGNRCEMCNIPDQNLTTKDGVTCCSRCEKKLATIPLCNYCQKRMLGAGISFPDRGINMCGDCKKRASLCKICRIPLGLAGDNNSHCSECLEKLAEAPCCNTCGKQLLESHTVYQTKDNQEIHICQNCKRKLRSCYVCGVPSKQTESHEGKDICQVCLAKLDRCGNCNAPVITYYNFTLSDYVYCKKCVDQNPSCDACGVPVDKNAPSLADGRIICEVCQETAVTEIADVLRIFEPLQRLIEKSLKMPVREIEEIRFADKQKMIELAKDIVIPGSRMENYPSGLFVRQGKKFRIYVLPSQPENILRGVLAHEFSHAFLAEYFPGNQKLEELEGFCEWIRYKVMRKYKDEKGIKKLLKRKDFYGNSFQKIRSIELKNGIHGVFQFISRFEEEEITGRFMK
jgi:hypothetical protein